MHKVQKHYLPIHLYNDVLRPEIAMAVTIAMQPFEIEYYLIQHLRLLFFVDEQIIPQGYAVDIFHDIKVIIAVEHFPVYVMYSGKIIRYDHAWKINRAYVIVLGKKIIKLSGVFIRVKELQRFIGYGRILQVPDLVDNSKAALAKLFNNHISPVDIFHNYLLYHINLFTA